MPRKARASKAEDLRHIKPMEPARTEYRDDRTKYENDRYWWVGDTLITFLPNSDHNLPGFVYSSVVPQDQERKIVLGYVKPDVKAKLIRDSHRGVWVWLETFLLFLDQIEKPEHVSDKAHATGVVGYRRLVDELKARRNGPQPKGK